MAVVQVIDDADVLHASRLQGLHHREQVLGFTEPIPVIVQAHLAALRGASVADGFKPRHFGGDTGLLIRGVFGQQGTAVPHHP